MNKAILIPAVMLAGAATGAASSWGVTQLHGSAGPTEARAQAALPPAEDMTFVTTGAILIPVTLSDGSLTAYVTIECSLQVGSDQAEGVQARIPLLIHAINMRAFRAPLATGPDQRVPDLQRYRAIVEASAKEVLGSGIVQRIAITKVQAA